MITTEKLDQMLEKLVDEKLNQIKGEHDEATCEECCILKVVRESAALADMAAKSIYSALLTGDLSFLRMLLVQMFRLGQMHEQELERLGILQ